MPADNPPNRSPQAASPPAGPAVQVLLERVERVARRATWWLRLRAMMLLVASVLLAVGTLVVIDWIWKTPPLGGRLGMSGLAAVAILAAVWRWGRSVWSRKIGLLAAARRIEYRFPQLSDRLSSLVALEATDPVPLAQPLVALAADETELQSRTLNFFDALDGRRVGWAAAGLVVVVSTVLGVSCWVPQVVQQGLARLATPWNELPWPRHDYLVLTIDDVVLAGQPVVVAVDNVAEPSRPLPRDVRVEWRSNPPLAQTPRPGLTQSLAVDQESGRAILEAALTQSAFEIRASGGDDDTMRWRRVEVVPPPHLTQPSFLVTPPSATGASEFAETGERFSIPEHSRLTFTARSDRPIQSAQMVNQTAETQIPLQLDSSGQRMTGQWSPQQLDDSLQLSVAWTDADGLSGIYSRHWQVTVVRDTPPAVRWTMASEDLRVTKDAVLELQFTARDNYRLVASGLQWGAAFDEPPETAVDPTAWPHYQAVDAAKQTRSITLAVADFPAGESSTAWLLQAVAQDSAGQVGRSLPLRIYLLSEQDLLTELTKDSQQVLDQVRAAVRSQQIAAERTREAGLQSDPQDRQDSLNIAQAAQQQALQQVDGPAAALPIAQRITARATTNRVQSEFLETVQRAAEQLAQLRDQSLQPSAQTLDAAVKQEATDPTPSGLADLAGQQTAAAKQLQQISEQLAAGLESQLVAESIRDAAAAQQRLAAASRRAAGEGGDGDEPGLTDALADQQRDVARQTERLQDRLRDLADAAQQSGQDGQRLQAAAERLGEQQIADRMRSAADELEQRHSDVAADVQQAIARDMRRIASEFSDSAGQASATRLADQTAQLARRQREVSQQIAETLRRDGVDSETAIAQQSDTLDAVEELRPEMEDMPLFPEALEQVQQRMESALARMRRSPTDPQSYTDARAASERLEEIASSIEQSSRADRPPSDPNADAASPPPADAADGAAEEPPTSLPIASLFLVRSMQTRLRNETAQLDGQAIEPENAEAITRLRQQRQQLSLQQAQLAQRLQSLLNDSQDDSPNAAATSPQKEADDASLDGE